jgi:hypothetical protein
MLLFMWRPLKCWSQKSGQVVFCKVRVIGALGRWKCDLREGARGRYLCVLLFYEDLCKNPILLLKLIFLLDSLFILLRLLFLGGFHWNLILWGKLGSHLPSWPRIYRWCDSEGDLAKIKPAIMCLCQLTEALKLECYVNESKNLI